MSAKRVREGLAERIGRPKVRVTMSYHDGHERWTAIDGAREAAIEIDVGERVAVVTELLAEALAQLDV